MIMDAAMALLILAMLGAQVGAPPGAVPTSIDEPVYVPAGVIDADGTVGCLRTPSGGVEAVDLATGRTLWRSAVAAMFCCDEPTTSDGTTSIRSKPARRWGSSRARWTWRSSDRAPTGHASRQKGLSWPWRP